ncbi:hypothetical protein LG198_00020, partial [Methylobacillus arboreus]|uniref:RHS repeat domain-containing protein n=1 Tax=Methylobacillus arboreus TaxID=755170 RepID=UPI001E64DF16
VLGTLMGGKTSTLGTAVSSLAGGYSELKAGYDRAGQVISRTDALGNLNTQGYNAFGELASENFKIDAGPNGSTNYTYDRRGNLKSKVMFEGGFYLSNTHAYDAFGRVTQSADGRGNTTKYEYDRLGRQITLIDATNTTSRTTYDAHDRILTKVDGRNQTTTTVYNSAARTMVMTTAEGIQVTTTTNGFGETVSIQDGRGNTTTYAYNADGQLIRTTTPDNAVSLIDYDKAGRVWITTDARGVETVYRYDEANRLLSRRVETDGDSFTTLYYYDAQGRKAWERDANNIWTRTDYDAQGQIIAIVVDPLVVATNATGGTAANPTGLNLQTTFTYNALGQQVRVTQGAGTPHAQTVEYKYDRLGRRTQEIVDPDGLALKTTYTYSGAHYVMSKTDALGNVTRYTYDANNRVIHTVDALGQVTANTYDGNGNITKVTQYATAISLAGLPLNTPLNDVASRIVANAADRVTQYVYDKDNRLSFTVDANRYVTRHEVDAAGNVVKRTQYASVLQGTLAANGNIEIRTSGAGTGAYLLANTSQDRVEQTVYDQLNRVSFSLDAEGYGTSYAYDLMGNLTKVTQYANKMQGTLATNVAPTIVSGTGTGNTITLDSARDQVTHHYYDQRNLKSATIDAAGYLTTYRYTLNGQLGTTTRYTVKPGSVTDSSYSHTLQGDSQASQRVYDKAGRLQELREAVGTSDQINTLYAYDAAGHLISKTIAYGTGAAVTTRYAYDKAGRLLDETRAHGTPEAITTHYEYDALGNQVRILEAYGTADQRLTQQQFDTLGRKTGAIDALGHSITTEYNAFGDIVKLTDANGNAGYFYT